MINAFDIAMSIIAEAIDRAELEFKECRTCGSGSSAPCDCSLVLETLRDLQGTIQEQVEEHG